MQTCGVEDFRVKTFPLQEAHLKGWDYQDNGLDFSSVSQN